MPRLRGFPRRKHGKNAACAFDQLNIGDNVAKFIDILWIKKAVAFDNHQHVIFVRRKAPRQILELVELGRIGAKQGTERIVDLELRHAECGEDAKRGHNHRRQERSSQRNEPNALEAQHKAIAARVFGWGLPSGGILISIGAGHGHPPVSGTFGTTTNTPRGSPNSLAAGHDRTSRE